MTTQHYKLNFITDNMVVEKVMFKPEILDSVQVPFSMVENQVYVDLSQSPDIKPEKIMNMILRQ
jgi:hypothetical protein